MDDGTFWGSRPGRTLRFIIIVVGGLILVLGAYNFIHSPSKPKPTPPKKTPTISVYKAPKPVTITTEITYSCPDYDSIFGPNYNNQLYINWSIWSNILTFNTSTGDMSVVNYQYNAAANESYRLYTSSMSNVNCNPSIAAPNQLSPATAPSFSFSPTNTTPNSDCNIALAYQYFESFESQYYNDLQQEQTALQNWLSKQQSGSGVVTQSVQQGSIALQTTLYNQVKQLAQYYNDQAAEIGCPA